MRIGIQGQPGSACDEAASLLSFADSDSFEYLTDAAGVLAALGSGAIDRAVLAAESPVGSQIPETVEALAKYPSLKVVKELRKEVKHCIMVRSDNANSIIRKIASHAIPLAKHKTFLEKSFPGYESVELPDTGLAAKHLAEGLLSVDTAVIAMPRAAEIFGLKIIENKLPANDNYLTRFIVMEKA